MKKIFTMFLLLFLLVATTSWAADPMAHFYGCNNGWCYSTDCTASIGNGTGCYNSNTHEFCIGNGTTCAAVNSSSVTNGTFTTALTNNGGAGMLTWPAAGATLTVPSGGGTLGTAAFTATGAYAPSSSTSTATDWNKWDGGATGLTAATGLTSLGIPGIMTGEQVGSGSAATLATTQVSVTAGDRILIAYFATMSATGLTFPIAYTVASGSATGVFQGGQGNAFTDLAFDSATVAEQCFTLIFSVTGSGTLVLTLNTSSTAGTGKTYSNSYYMVFLKKQL